MPRARRSPAKSRARSGKYECTESGDMSGDMSIAENLDKHCGPGSHPPQSLPNGHSVQPQGPAVNGIGYPPNSPHPGAGLPELNATDLSDTLDSIVAQIPFDDGHGMGHHHHGGGPGGPYPPTSYPGPRPPMMPGSQYMMQGRPGVPQHMQHPGPPMTSGPGSTGKIYPVNQPMVFNPSNPNAPPIYPCGRCHKEVHDNDQAILCESGCNFWFHRICTGLSEPAYQMLRNEVYAEWVCDSCLAVKNIPLVKMKP